MCYGASCLCSSALSSRVSLLALCHLAETCGAVSQHANTCALPADIRQCKLRWPFPMLEIVRDTPVSSFIPTVGCTTVSPARLRPLPLHQCYHGCHCCAAAEGLSLRCCLASTCSTSHWAAGDVTSSCDPRLILQLSPKQYDCYPGVYPGICTELQQSARHWLHRPPMVSIDLRSFLVQERLRRSQVDCSVSCRSDAALAEFSEQTARQRVVPLRTHDIAPVGAEVVQVLTCLPSWHSRKLFCRSLLPAV